MGKAEMKSDELVAWRIFTAEAVHLQRVLESDKAY